MDFINTNINSRYINRYDTQKESKAGDALLNWHNPQQASYIDRVNQGYYRGRGVFNFTPRSWSYGNTYNSVNGSAAIVNGEGV